LKNLCSLKLKFTIQDGEKDSIQDAKAVMQLYQLVKIEWEYQLIKNEWEQELKIRNSSTTSASEDYSRICYKLPKLMDVQNHR
jgi:hypothetical protein